MIDVRLNLGGSDILGQAIALRLATKPYVAYRKVGAMIRRTHLHGQSRSPASSSRDVRDSKAPLSF